MLKTKEGEKKKPPYFPTIFSHVNFNKGLIYQKKKKKKSAFPSWTKELGWPISKGVILIRPRFPSPMGNDNRSFDEGGWLGRKGERKKARIMNFFFFLFFLYTHQSRPPRAARTKNNSPSLSPGLKRCYSRSQCTGNEKFHEIFPLCSTRSDRGEERGMDAL